MTTDLQLWEERYALAVDGSDDGLWDWDLINNKVFYANRWKIMIGYEDPEEIGDFPNEWLERLHPDDQEKFRFSIESYLQDRKNHFKAEYRIRHKQGHYLWMLCRGRGVWDRKGRPVRFIGFQTDITVKKNMEHQLIYDAFHDPLTGLSNRALFMDRLNQALHSRSSFAVLYMDLDRFKQVNDTLGHGAGDTLLVITARRLETCSRAGDTIARLGGDEFALLLTNITNREEVETIAKRIINEISTPFIIEKQTIHETITIGIALGNSLNYSTPEEIIRDADIALYQGKKKRKGGYEVFNKKTRQLTASNLRLEVDLKNDIKKGRILFYYQPIIDLKTGKIIGLEALLRWEHEQCGVLKPANFLAIAEETQLVINLEKTALEIASKQFEKLQKYIQSKKFFITFNISSQHLRDMDFSCNLQKILNFPSINPSLFQIEISENMIINNLDHIDDIFRTITALGFKLSLDGFGTGYSSLTYLHQYPFDFLKIDRSCIADLGGNQKKIKFVENIIKIAKSLNIAIIAEGVESESTYKILQKLHCTYAQGYYFSKPLPIEKIIELF